MTLIEFFYKDSVENICSALLKKADRVIFVCNKTKKVKAYMERYSAFFENRGISIEIKCRSVNKNSMQSVLKHLTAIVEEYDDCVFDLTGGDELYLVATGIIVGMHPDKKIQMHRFNIVENSIIDVDMDGKTLYSGEMPQLSVDDNIRIYGGGIVYDDFREGATYLWNMSHGFRKDIRAMWRICRGNAKVWNLMISFFAVADRLGGGGDQLEIRIPSEDLRAAVKGTTVFFMKGMITALTGAKLLSDFRYDKEVFSIRFKNPQVKYCLTIAGQILEMKVLLAALE